MGQKYIFLENFTENAPLPTQFSELMPSVLIKKPYICIQIEHIMP